MAICRRARNCGEFSDLFTEYQFLHEDMKYHFESFPMGAHPMAILSAMINGSELLRPGTHGLALGKANQFDIYAAKLISQVRTIAAYAYRKSRGLPLIYPKNAYKYTANFLHMLFSTPYEDFELEAGSGEGAGFDFPAARRSRAKLLDLDGAHGGIEPGQSVCQRGGRRLRALGALARRRQPGGD